MLRVFAFLLLVFPGVVFAQGTPITPPPQSLYGLLGLWSQPQTFTLGHVDGPWTTSTRPPSPGPGLTGYNSTIGSYETWNGTAWVGTVANLTAPGPIGSVTPNTVAATTLSSTSGVNLLGGGNVDGVTLGNATADFRLNVNRTTITYGGSNTHNTPLNTGINLSASMGGTGGGPDSNGGNDIWASPFSLSIPNDTLSYTGSNYVTGFEIQHNFGGVGQTVTACVATPSLCGTGARAGEVVVLTQRGPTGNTANTPYVAQVANVSIDFNDGGTAGYANARGAVTSHNAICGLGSGATFFAVIKCYEGDFGIQAGGSSRSEFGILVQEQGGDAVRPSNDDAGIAVSGSSGGVGLQYIVALGTSFSVPPTASDTTIIGCPPNNALVKCTGAHGFDLSTNFNWPTGSIPFTSPGFYVDNLGNSGATSVSTNTVEALGSVSAIVPASSFFAGGYTSSTPPVITVASPPGAGVPATAVVATYGYNANIIVSGGTGYIVGDIISGPSPLRLEVTAVNGSGAITATVFFGGNPPLSSIPTSPFAFTGGTGTGATFTLAYQPLTVTVVTGGGPYVTPPAVTFSGAVFPFANSTGVSLLNEIMTMIGGINLDTRTITTGASDTALTSDVLIKWDKTTGAASSENIAACSSSNKGRILTVVDGKGDAATNNITITPASGTVGGQANVIIAKGYGAVSIQCDGVSDWTVLYNTSNSATTIGTLTPGDGVTIDVTGSLKDSGSVLSTSYQNIQTFTASGTWTKPAFCALTNVSCYSDINVIAGGPSGASGGQATLGTAVSGGGSGGGGACVMAWKYPASGLGATIAVTVGSSGALVAGSSSGAGTQGNPGNGSSFGSVLAASTGGTGSGGQVSGSSAGGGGGGYDATGTNASGATPGSSNLIHGITAGGFGATAGIASTTGTGNTGGSGASVTSFSSASAATCIGGSASGGTLTTTVGTQGGTGGSVVGKGGGTGGAAATTGTAPSGNPPTGNGATFPLTSGAGGGGANNGGTGGDGGSCPGSGAYGVSGGGGGSGTIAGGAGGSGCPGYVAVVTYGNVNGN